MKEKYIKCLKELTELSVGWDGYAGEPTSKINADKALKILDIIYEPGQHEAQIIPGPEGDLCIEWRGTKSEITLWVDEPDPVYIDGEMNREDLWLDDKRVCSEMNGEETIITDFTLVRKLLRVGKYF